MGRRGGKRRSKQTDPAELELRGESIAALVRAIQGGNSAAAVAAAKMVLGAEPLAPAQPGTDWDAVARSAREALFERTQAIAERRALYEQQTAAQEQEQAMQTQAAIRGFAEQAAPNGTPPERVAEIEQLMEPLLVNTIEKLLKEGVR